MKGVISTAIVLIILMVLGAGLMLSSITLVKSLINLMVVRKSELVGTSLQDFVFLSQSSAGEVELNVNFSIPNAHFNLYSQGNVLCIESVDSEKNVSDCYSFPYSEGIQLSTTSGETLRFRVKVTA